MTGDFSFSKGNVRYFSPQSLGKQRDMTASIYYQQFYQWFSRPKKKMTQLTISSGNILLPLFFLKRKWLFFCLQARAENGLKIPSWILHRHWSEKVIGSSPFWLWERIRGCEAPLIPTSPLFISFLLHQNWQLSRCQKSRDRAEISSIWNGSWLQVRFKQQILIDFSRIHVPCTHTPFSLTHLQHG